MEKKWTPEEICECIRIRKAGGEEMGSAPCEAWI